MNGGGEQPPPEQPRVKVCDRTALILDIFSQRAATREGKLQVRGRRCGGRGCRGGGVEVGGALGGGVQEGRCGGRTRAERRCGEGGVERGGAEGGRMEGWWHDIALLSHFRCFVVSCRLWGKSDSLLQG